MTLRLQRLPLAPAATAMMARFAAIALALVISGLILAAAGADPLALLRRVLVSSFGSRFGLEDLGLLVAPLILTGLAVAVMQRIGL